MDYIYNSLDEVVCEAERLMKLSKKELEGISEDSILRLFCEAERLVISKTQELADTLGFDKLKSVRLVCFRWQTKLGDCDQYGNIRIDFKTLFGCECACVISVLVHELCHTEIHNHTKEFWTLFEQSAKKVGILSPEYNGWWTTYTKGDNPYMYKRPWEYHDDPKKYKIIRDKICTFSSGGEYHVKRESHKEIRAQLN